MFKTVLQVHNFYQQPGGEERVLQLEKNLLEAKGHRVFQYTVHNDTLKSAGAWDKGKAAVQGLWNNSAYRDMRALLRRFQPDIAHFHNTFPLISPAAYYAARAEGIPVVQTLHNYRLMCANGFFFNQGSSCERCMGKLLPWSALRYRCYRQGFLPTAAVTAVSATHKLIRTWRDKVDAYIALTDFAKEKFVQGGLPAEKIHVKANFIFADSPSGGSQGNYFLFVGRLSEEKGIRTLLKAWEEIPDIPLKIAGDGPLADLVHGAVRANSNIEWLGRQSTENILQLMREAMALVFPSVWFEGFPVTVVEALSAGLPIIASDIGAMRRLIQHGVTGFHFAPGHASQLADAVQKAYLNGQCLTEMRPHCRGEFLRKYSPEVNYATLLKIYSNAERNFRRTASRWNMFCLSRS